MLPSFLGCADLPQGARVWLPRGMALEVLAELWAAQSRRWT